MKHVQYEVHNISSLKLNNNHTNMSLIIHKHVINLNTVYLLITVTINEHSVTQINTSMLLLAVTTAVTQGYRE